MRNNEMWIIFAAFATSLAAAAPQAYVMNAAPVALLPVYNYPYRGGEIRPLNNSNSQNSTNVPSRCMPHDYDSPLSHSGFYGCRKPSDKLLFVENVYKPNRFLSTREKFIAFPGDLPKGHVRNEVITAVWCYDVRGYGKGGFCSIIDGGIGKKHVRVHMYHTERNVPLHFKLEIYGNTTAAVH